MIKKTTKYRVKVDSPFCYFQKGSFFEYTNAYPWKAEDYPEMFEPVYRLQDGSEKCIGDYVWRSKNYEVKTVMFNPTHVSQETPLFGTMKACEEWLEKNAKNIKTELLKQNRDSSFQKLKAWANELEEELEDIGNASYNNIKNISTGIKASIENIETAATSKDTEE